MSDVLVMGGGVQSCCLGREPTLCFIESQNLWADSTYFGAHAGVVLLLAEHSFARHIFAPIPPDIPAPRGGLYAGRPRVVPMYR